MLRRAAPLLSVLVLMTSRAEAKDTGGRFGLGGGVSVPGGHGELTLTYSLSALDLILGLDLDIGKAQDEDVDIFFGGTIAVFWKPLQTSAINAGLQAGFTAGVSRIGSVMADPAFHPALFAGFRADWFPESNDHFAFYTSVDMVFDFVPSTPVLGDPVNRVAPSTEGFAFGFGPTLSLGFRYFFGATEG